MSFLNTLNIPNIYFLGSLSLNQFLIYLYLFKVRMLLLFGFLFLEKKNNNNNSVVLGNSVDVG